MAHSLDCRRLLCPLPVIRLQDKVKQLPSGSQIEVTCTDPGTQHDIPTWCRLYGHKVLSIEHKEIDEDEEIYFLVEVV